MEKKLIVRGVLAGAIAGLLAFGTGAGMIAFGAAMGALFAVAYALYLGRVGGVRARTLALMAAAGGFVAMYLVPFIKYPANPPAIGHPETIRQRGELYLAMVVVSVAMLVFAVWLGQRLKARFGTWNAVLVAAAVSAVVMGALRALLPELGQLAVNRHLYGNHATETPLPLRNSHGVIVYPGFPADALFSFRLYSIAAQLVLWGAIGLIFAPLADRLLAPGPARRLAELASFGPYFAVEVHPPGSPLRAPWQLLGELTGSPDALAARIGEVRERLAAAAGCQAADIEFRVAASVAQLGLCARLLSPVLGAAVAGWALSAGTAQARWVPALGGPFRLSLPEAAAGADAPEGGAAACLELLAGPIAQVIRAVEAMAVSPQVLWGNVASAVNGAATMIAAARPDLAAAAVGAAGTALDYPALAGTYRGSPGAGFRRRNCCLIYRLSPPGPARYCGDCVLGPGPVR